MELYGMPMLKSSVGLQTLLNGLSQGAIGAEILFLDEEISFKIYTSIDVEELKYRELAAQAAKDFDIKPPQPEKCASVGSWIGQCIGAAFDGIFKGLFKGLGPLLLIAGGALLVFFLLK